MYILLVISDAEDFAGMIYSFIDILLVIPDEEDFSGMIYSFSDIFLVIPDKEDSVESYPPSPIFF